MPTGVPDSGTVFRGVRAVPQGDSHAPPPPAANHFAFLEFGAEERRRLEGIRRRLTPRIPHIVAEYCEHLAAYREPAEALRRVDRGAFEADVARYLDEILRCEFTDRHVRERGRIGLAHGESHLAHVWYTGSYHFLGSRLAQALHDGAGSHEEYLADRCALDKALAYDLGLIMNAHVQEYAESLRARNQELLQERASRVQCAQMLVHDMSNPLTTLSATTEVLADLGSDPAVFQRCIEILRRNEHRLGVMLLNVLDAYRAESGGLTVQPEPVDLGALAAEVLAEFDFPDVPDQPQYVLDAPPALPAVHADRALLVRVLWNLLDNATKHTPVNGRICVQLRAGAPAEDVRVRVEDSGPGIRPELRERIFETFFTCAAAAEAIAENARRGTGLGLPFCRAVIEAHGRSLQVEESSGGTGAVFAFTLPVRTDA